MSHLRHDNDYYKEFKKRKENAGKPVPLLAIIRKGYLAQENNWERIEKLLWDNKEEGYVEIPKKELREVDRLRLKKEKFLVEDIMGGDNHNQYVKAYKVSWDF